MLIEIKLPTRWQHFMARYGFWETENIKNPFRHCESNQEPLGPQFDERPHTECSLIMTISECLPMLKPWGF